MRIVHIAELVLGGSIDTADRKPGGTLAITHIASVYTTVNISTNASTIAGVKTRATKDIGTATNFTDSKVSIVITNGIGITSKGPATTEDFIVAVGEVG